MTSYSAKCPENEQARQLEVEKHPGPCPPGRALQVQLGSHGAIPAALELLACLALHIGIWGAL